MKQLLKKAPKLISILILALTLSCSGLFDSPSEVDDTTQQTENSEQTDDTKNGSIAKEYWGTWIRMDTGDEYYIDSQSITNRYSSSTIATSIKGYTLDGDNVMKNGSTVYFRKGGSARDFLIQELQEQLALESREFQVVDKIKKTKLIQRLRLLMKTE